MSFDDYPAGYPTIDDWDAYVSQLLPDIAANGLGKSFYLTLVEPLRSLESDNAALYAGVVELNDASGQVLDLLGDFVNEPRQGLSDQLYRRIIAGRRVAKAGAVTRPKVAAGWRALTGDPSGRMDEIGNASIILSASVSFTPTDPWLSRAGRVVRDLVGAGYQVTAAVSTPGAGRWQDPTAPWNVGRWAYQLRVPQVE